MSIDAERDYGQEESYLADVFAPEPAPVESQAPPERSFEDLTMAEALGMVWRNPLPTLRAIARVAQMPPDDSRLMAASVPAVAVPVPGIAHPEAVEAILEDLEPALRPRAETVQLLIRLVGLALAIWGGVEMFRSGVYVEELGLNLGAPFLLAGFVVWLVGEALFARLATNDRPLVAPAAHRSNLEMGATTLRIVLAVLAAICALLAWVFNGNNLFTLPGVLAWLGAIVLTVWTFAPARWTPLTPVAATWDAIRRPRLRLSWTFVVLIVITAGAAYFRLTDLSGTPPELTSDHVEKLLDVNRVLQGQTNVFFANNHGRDAIQFYLLAFMASVFRMELNFDLLKLATAIEGIITIPVLWWMGREVIGGDNRKLGNLVGLMLAALVAVSYWHVGLSRLGLRIVLTPLFTALIVGFLARALRYNRRADFIAIGLTLGIGLYAYQAIRMMPIVIVIGVVIALIFKLRDMASRRQMVWNLLVLVVVAFVVFVPLFRLSVDYPQDFWRRTSGRLFGDDLTQQVDENGNLVARTPTLQEQIDAFSANVPALLSNYRGALLMYNWKGDVAWFHNAPHHPAMDIITGGLLIVGVAAWIGRMIRRRDPMDWLILPMILIMMLPSALSLAYPIENPSATRMSGTLPGVYLLAAFPLALIVRSLTRLMGRFGTALGAVAAAGLLFFSYSANAQTYFEDYRLLYTINSLPYSDGGQVMREFVDEGGSYGNVFIMAYPYWWDHRALGIEGGRIDFPHTILSVDAAAVYLRDAALRADEYRLDPNGDLLFFYHPGDETAQNWLQAQFPNGFWRIYETYQPGDSFKVYRVTAPGERGFADFLIANDLARDE